MKVSELKEKIGSPLDKRAGLILAANALKISYPELRENHELQNLIKQKNNCLFDKLNEFWLGYLNCHYFIKGIIEHAKHDELSKFEIEKLNSYLGKKDELFKLLIGELDSIKILN